MAQKQFDEAAGYVELPASILAKLRVPEGALVIEIAATLAKACLRRLRTSR